MSKHTTSIHLITGATGQIGSLVVDRLLAREERPRVFVRSADKARARWGDRVDIVIGDFDDAAAFRSAMDGTSTLYLLTSGPALSAHDVAAARAARDAGVSRIVKLSSLDAREGVGTGVWHARGETAIRDSGIAFSFIQPTGFQSNALYWARSIANEGVVRACTGDGRIPFVHPADIADVSVAALTSATWEGESLALTGPDALSYPEMTAIIGHALGRALRHMEMSEDETRRQQTTWGATPEMVDARLSIFRAIREGRLATVTHDVERVLGRAPRTFSSWVEENVTAFRA